jgi:hypothetical protein
MQSENLSKKIFKGIGHPSEKIFRDWLSSSQRFYRFTEIYQDKISKKLKEAIKDNIDPGEKVNDVIFELEVAYLLHGYPHFLQVEYEKFTSEENRNPDFTVLATQGRHFNIEVKRIRESGLEKRFEIWEYQVAEAIHKISSETLIFSFVITDKQGQVETYEPDLIDRLEKGKSAIIKFIADSIPSLERTLAVGDSIEYLIPDFEKEVKVEFSKPKLRSVSSFVQCRRSISRPVFYIQDEYRKFGDIIEDLAIALREISIA